MDVRYELLECCIKDSIEKIFSDMGDNFTNKINEKAIMALDEIKSIISDDGLSDFDAVEDIVCVLEKYNIYCGGRHDF